MLSEPALPHDVAQQHPWWRWQCLSSSSVHGVKIVASLWGHDVAGHHSSLGAAWPWLRTQKAATYHSETVGSSSKNAKRTGYELWLVNAVGNAGEPQSPALIQQVSCTPGLLKVWSVFLSGLRGKRSPCPSFPWMILHPNLHPKGR
jgi:hypothetical protein